MITQMLFELCLFRNSVQCTFFLLTLYFSHWKRNSAKFWPEKKLKNIISVLYLNCLRIPTGIHNFFCIFIPFYYFKWVWTVIVIVTTNKLFLKYLDTYNIDYLIFQGNHPVKLSIMLNTPYLLCPVYAAFRMLNERPPQARTFLKVCWIQVNN